MNIGVDRSNILDLGRVHEHEIIDRDLLSYNEVSLLGEKRTQRLEIVSEDILGENETGTPMTGKLEDQCAEGPNGQCAEIVTDMPKQENPDAETEHMEVEDIENKRNNERLDENMAPTETEKSQSASEQIRERNDANDVNQFDSVSNARSLVHRQNEVYQHKSKDAIFSRNVELAKESVKTPVSQNQQQPSAKPKLKKMKKGIFFSYSPDAGFLERKFVTETVRQLKENNLAEDIWFDKDEQNIDNPCWFSMRLETVEKCRAAVLVISDSYFTCPVSVYECKTLLERNRSRQNPCALFPIVFRQLEKTETPRDFNMIAQKFVDLTGEHAKKSLAEKASVVIGSIMEELEKYATMNVPLPPSDAPDTEFTGAYKKKKICRWTAADLQEWMFKLGIKEFYRQSLAENMVDGFLLMSLKDDDMVSHLSIDSRVVRKKIMQQILQTLDKENKQPENWHLRARAQRAKPDVVYLIYDPADVRLAQNVKNDLKRKGLQVGIKIN